MSRGRSGRCCITGLLLLLAGGTDLSASPIAGGKAASLSYQEDIVPILRAACYSCHGEEKQKGDLRLDTLSPDFLGGGDADTWHDALNQVHLGEMPPPKAERQLTDEEREVLTAWLDHSLEVVVAARRNAGGRVTSRRLTRQEYANTMRDLLGVELDYARELPPEPVSPEGFLNNGRSLEMSPTQVETYLAVARRALELAIVEGDRPVVHEVESSTTAVGRLPRRKEGGAIPVNPEFVLDVPEFPREGEFEITVRAGASIPDGHDFPRLRVSLGCVPGIVHVPRKLVAEVDVTAPADQPQTFVFRGRMEDYPQAGERRFGGNVDFNGVIVMLDFLDADGRELRYPHSRYSDPAPKPKKNKQGQLVPVPELPSPPEKPYLDIVIDSVRYEAPLVASWPPPSHRALLGDAREGERSSDRARRVLERFVPRAYRRTVTAAEVDGYVTFFESLAARDFSFQEAMRETLAAVLVSPHFLYLVDTRDDFVVANRLSYLLWGTAPDERLMALATAGRLADPKVLEGEVERLVNDSRCRAFTDRFADQWFDLGGLDRVAVNPEFHPDFDNTLKEAMKTETREVFAEILKGDLSTLELIDSNWTMVNRALATHYGLAQRPRSSRFERVIFEEGDHRGGILQHGSFLLANSNGESSHPIKRAVWILDRLIDSPPSPPPPDVPELDAESPDLAGLTLKEQLAVHREKASCRSCHENLDPWGVALEHFDATGRFQEYAAVRQVKKEATASRGARLDPTTELPDGTQLDGAESLKRYLLEHRRPQFARGVVKRLTGFALGRSLDLGDRELVETLTARFEQNGYRLRGLIVDLVSNERFRDS